MGLWTPLFAGFRLKEMVSCNACGSDSTSIVLSSMLSLTLWAQDHRYAGGLSEAEKRKRWFRYHLRRHLVYRRMIPEDLQIDTRPVDWYLAQSRARRIVAPPPVLGM